MSGFTLAASTTTPPTNTVNLSRPKEGSTNSNLATSKKNPEANKTDEWNPLNFIRPLWQRFENIQQCIINSDSSSPPKSPETTQAPVATQTEKSKSRITNTEGNYTSWDPDLKSPEKTTDTIDFKELKEGKLKLGISSKEYWLREGYAPVIRKSHDNPADIVVSITDPDNILPNKELIIKNFFQGNDNELKSPGGLKVKLNNGEQIEAPFYWMQEAKE